MSANEDVKPVMALNPYTNKLVNIEPLFRIYKLHGDLADSIEGVMRSIVTNELFEPDNFFPADPFDNIPRMFSFIYDLKDMFVRLEECQISMPEKKGAKS